MNLYSYFSHDFHRPLFEVGKKDRLLTLSGVGNVSAKALLASGFARFLGARNIFWILDNNKLIYEMQNTLPFWADANIAALDQLTNIDQHNYRVAEFVSRFKHHGHHFTYLINQNDVGFPLPKLHELYEEGILVRAGQEMRAVVFFNQLIQMGYQPGTDTILKKGEYRRAGGVLNVYPPNLDCVVKIELAYDRVMGIWLYDTDQKTNQTQVEQVDILPIEFRQANGRILDNLTPEDLLVIDDLDQLDPDLMQTLDTLGNRVPRLVFTSFPRNEEKYFHLRYLSVLKFYNIFDLTNDLRDKHQNHWNINILTKRADELMTILKEERIPHSKKRNAQGISVIDATDLEHIPPSFQNPEYKIEFLTDKEIFNLKRERGRRTTEKINLDFLTGLRMGDLVVHFDHGIGRFMGVVSRTIDDIRREYLEIAYAENDRLFVPIDQADKVSKFVGGEDNEPQLSRLGATEWRTVSHKVKKETEKIAKELLNLYAKRAQVKGHNYGPDTEEQRRFESSFPYEETPGQIKAIQDVKQDMESDQPMDRLVCGDVGFGKTEVAMRAAFKAVQGGKQVAFISPITILADQHYKTFSRRAETFPMKIEMLSRFRTAKEQTVILEKLRKGEIHIVIGTHRLLQPDVKFFNLGLVIIDEEQRFGVKQKEKFKQLRSSIDILTLTATPIPRTLNLALNKLRDITTITTPPPGRLPIITEVRRYGDQLIMEAIQREIDRQGQVYFLHNRVETIESIADKLRKLMPAIRFIVAHGQLHPADLEKRIMNFKNRESDVLISSTIIENGIDLPNANTLIVDDAEHFGLSQLYQLRGRIGRAKIQAYAYFLYQSRQPRLDAKKRLRAIVDASELGSGFQIAMRDLEIRGAGDILGVNQHGTIRVVGINHFLRMLNKTIEEMKSGLMQSDEGAKVDVSIELPMEAFIPDTYIPDTKEKINVYQRLSAVDQFSLLDELRDDLIAEYGKLPKQVITLFRVLEIKLLAKQAGLVNVKSVILGKGAKQIILHMGKTVRPAQIMELLKYNSQWLISGDKLKINLRGLGFNWSAELCENIKHLIPQDPNKFRLPASLTPSTHVPQTLP